MPLSTAGKAAALCLAPSFHWRRRGLYPSSSALPGYTLARARGKSHLAWFSSQWASEVWSRWEGLLFHSCKYLPNAGTSQISNPEGTIVGFLYKWGHSISWLNVITGLLLPISYLHSITVPWLEHPWEDLCSVVSLKLIIEKGCIENTCEWVYHPGQHQGNINSSISTTQGCTLSMLQLSIPFWQLVCPPALGASLSTVSTKPTMERQEAFSINCLTHPGQTLTMQPIQIGENVEDWLGTSQTRPVQFGEDESRLAQAAQERRHPALHQLAPRPYTLGSWRYFCLPFSQPHSPLKSSHMLNYGLDGEVHLAADV